MVPPMVQGEWKRNVFRTDLNTYWQQRTAGNDVLKLSFDLYTGGFKPNDRGFVSIAVLNDKELLVNYQFNKHSKILSGGLPFTRGDTNESGGLLHLPLNGGLVTLPAESWVILELYIDYTSSKVYFSIPALNYTMAYNTNFPLSLTGIGEGQDDSPVKLNLVNFKSINGVLQDSIVIKFDNINISATNTVPTVSVNTFISEKFNLYPNPVTDIITVTNSENIGISEVVVYDTTGKQIKTKRYNNENNVQLNLADIAAGVYLLHIQTKERTVVKKVIKN